MRIVKALAVSVTSVAVLAVGAPAHADTGWGFKGKPTSSTQDTGWGVQDTGWGK